MEEYLRQVEHNIALSKELIRQSNRLIDETVVWLAFLSAHRERENFRQIMRASQRGPASSRTTEQPAWLADSGAALARKLLPGTRRCS